MRRFTSFVLLVLIGGAVWLLIDSIQVAPSDPRGRETLSDADRTRATPNVHELVLPEASRETVDEIEDTRLTDIENKTIVLDRRGRPGFSVRLRPLSNVGEVLHDASLRAHESYRVEAGVVQRQEPGNLHQAPTQGRIGRDEDPSYLRLDGLSGQQFHWLIVEAPHHARRIFPLAEGSDAGAVIDLGDVVLPDSRPLQVRVQDEFDRPVAAADLRFERDSERMDSISTDAAGASLPRGARTGSDGTVEVFGLPYGAALIVHASATGFLSSSLAVPTSAQSVVLSLKRGASIEVLVRDVSGTGLADIPVALTDQQPPLRFDQSRKLLASATITDAQGRAQFAGLEEGSRWRAVARLAGVEDLISEEQVVGSRIELQASTPWSVQGRFLSGGKAYQGGGRVGLYSSRAEQIDLAREAPTVEIDSEGHFECRAVAGTYLLKATTSVGEYVYPRILSLSGPLDLGSLVLEHPVEVVLTAYEIGTPVEVADYVLRWIPAERHSDGREVLREPGAQEVIEALSQGGLHWGSSATGAARRELLLRPDLYRFELYAERYDDIDFELDLRGARRVEHKIELTPLTTLVLQLQLPENRSLAHVPVFLEQVEPTTSDNREVFGVDVDRHQRAIFDWNLHSDSGLAEEYRVTLDTHVLLGTVRVTPGTENRIDLDLSGLAWPEVRVFRAGELVSQVELMIPETGNFVPWVRSTWKRLGETTRSANGALLLPPHRPGNYRLRCRSDPTQPYQEQELLLNSGPQVIDFHLES